jgi:transposase
MENKIDDFTVKKCSHTGLVIAYLNKLGFKDIFYNDVKSTHKDNHHHYERAMILISSRLDGGIPLYEIKDWFYSSSVSSYFSDLEYDLCDNNLGFTLEYLSKNGSRIYHELCVRMVNNLDIPKSNLCLDGSNVSFVGDFEGSDLVTYGYNRDKRKDLKQVNFGIGVMNRIPVFAEILSGNSNDHKLINPFLDIIRDMDYKSLIDNVVVDKLFSDEKTLDQLDNEGLNFIVGVNNNYSKLTQEKVVHILEEKPLLNIPYKTGYKGINLDEKLYGKYFQFLIFSETLYESKRETLIKHSNKIITEFDNLIEKAGKYCYKKKEKIIERAEKYLNKYKDVRLFFSYTVKDNQDKLSFNYNFDEESFNKSLSFVGYYIIATNNSNLNLTDVLTEYKSRDTVEKVIQLSKHHYKMSPFYLKKDDRIQGMLWIILLGALIISCIEFKVNQDKELLKEICVKGKVSEPIFRAFKQYNVIRWLHISRSLRNLQIIHYDGEWRYMSNIGKFTSMVLDIFKLSAADIYNHLWKNFL